MTTPDLKDITFLSALVAGGVAVLVKLIESTISKRTAKDKKEESQTTAQTALATASLPAQNELFKIFREEVDTLRKDIAHLKTEADTERSHRHRLEEEIQKMKTQLAEKDRQVATLEHRLKTERTNLEELIAHQQDENLGLVNKFKHLQQEHDALVLAHETLKISCVALETQLAQMQRHNEETAQMRADIRDLQHIVPQTPQEVIVVNTDADSVPTHVLPPAEEKPSEGKV